MRAMQIIRHGAPLVLAKIDRPEPGEGEVLIRVHACGVNFADTLMRAGKYQEKPTLPFAPGIEVCGTIAALGPGVTGWETGARIAASGGTGGFAEYAAAPAARCVAVPETMPDEIAAGFLVAYGTSHVALCHRAAMRPGETLLVLAASSGVGLSAVEIGKALGARVIGVARGDEKRAVVHRAGADHVLDAGADLRAEVKALGGADVVYDPVGGDAFDAALRSCNPGARIIPIGFASGHVPQIPANILLVKNLTVIGLYWGAYARLHPEILTESFAQLFAWYAEGRLHPHVSHVLPFADADAALDLLVARKATGKIVLRIG